MGEGITSKVEESVRHVLLIQQSTVVHDPTSSGESVCIQASECGRTWIEGYDGAKRGVWEGILDSGQAGHSAGAARRRLVVASRSAVGRAGVSHPVCNFLQGFYSCFSFIVPDSDVRDDGATSTSVCGAKSRVGGCSGRVWSRCLTEFSLFHS